tara:strand:+ start:351 stop:464 length:114 start_codon:yes stop_codon:yes gene_type:complete
VFDDKKIKRMTIVYEDGSITILIKQDDGRYTYERRPV